VFAVVRIRGRVGVPKPIEDTLKMLRLTRLYNCVLLPENSSVQGMLEKAKDWITWGEIEKETLLHMLKKRLRLNGGKRIDEKVLKEKTGYSNFEELADALLGNKVKLSDLEGIEPRFRLTPPSKGFKNKKLPWPKGDLGYRGNAINELLKRMI